MKKILIILLLLIPLILSAQTQIINVGTVANDGTGDRLRDAMIKINTNFSSVRDSFGNIYTTTQTNNLFTNQVAGALPLGDYAWLKTDTIFGQPQQVVTQTQLSSFEGGGSGLGMYELRGIIGTTTGFPVNGDSLIINTGFITHPNIQAYREGQLQWKNASNAGAPDGYKFNNVTGTLTFKPVFSTGELVVIHAFDPIIWTDLVPEGGAGGGGGSGESTLLTNLIASWSLDETTGTAFADNVGTNNGGSTATPSSTAKFGYSRNYTASNHYASVAYDASLALTGDELTISLWVRFTTLPSVAARNAYLFSTQRADAQFWSTLLYVDTNDQLRFYAKNTVPTSYLATSAVSAFSINTWYNIIAVVDGAGNNLKLLINGADAVNTTQAFAGTLYGFDSTVIIGGDGGTGAVAGYMDEVAYWLKSISAQEITDLQTKFHPFN